MMQQIQKLETLINNLVTYRNVAASPPKVETWGDPGRGIQLLSRGPGEPRESAGTLMHATRDGQLACLQIAAYSRILTSHRITLLRRELKLEKFMYLE